MSLVVCADPRPHRVAWEWGSLRLEAGNGIERFHADDILPDSREDCYLSTLHIERTDEHDSRPYYLVVENERGTDRHAIHLNVEGTFAEPLEMSYLLGIAGGCVAAILILICLCIYAVRSKKCCFKEMESSKDAVKECPIHNVRYHPFSSLRRYNALAYAKLAIQYGYELNLKPYN
ncbi:uncharacterized protein LOC119675644 [Teleopsis dalmanni]|uniref:uncharacterized protein LOC119675644 n=1 Tax=Teleopsis dalmanni TaxID=139649 RepID=UPI0018CD966F|nr:uncharacterized protein LOC119675644 [Teleopsis dalmanni]